jgi:2-aminoadipate transaminase
MAPRNTLRAPIEELGSRGDRPAILALQKNGVRSWSYSELDDRIRRLAAGLVDAGVGRSRIKAGPGNDNVEAVNAALRERRDALVEALGERIPEAEFVVPEGGYFLWLSLADDIDTPALLEAARERGVSFVAGPDFMLDGGRSSLRLSFAGVPVERIGEGIERLAGALDAVRSASRD